MADNKTFQQNNYEGLEGEIYEAINAQPSKVAKVKAFVGCNKKRIIVVTATVLVAAGVAYVAKDHLVLEDETVV